MKTARTSLFLVAVLGLLAVCGSVQATEDNSPISYWQFDEGSGITAYDFIGGNDGTIYGAEWTTGQVGGALSFDGLDDYVELGSPANLDDLPLDNFTVSAWIYDKHNAATIWGTIIGSEDRHYGWSFRTFSNAEGDRSLNFQVWYSTTFARSWSSDGTILQNTWHHVAAVWDANTKTAKLYIDGIEPSYQTAIAGAGIYRTDASKNKEIGRIPHVGGVQYFNGVIDEVAIYNRALSAEEVWELYLDGLSDYERAIKSIERAIDEKLEALERIDAALEREWAAHGALEQLLASGDYGDLDKRDIAAAQREIESAIRRQQRSRKVLLKSIERLEDSLSALGYEPEPPEPNE